jgi:hypothetical protein
MTALVSMANTIVVLIVATTLVIILIITAIAAAVVIVVVIVIFVVLHDIRATPPFAMRRDSVFYGLADMDPLSCGVSIVKVFGNMIYACFEIKQINVA